MLTFSQLIDQAVMETRRMDLLTLGADYLNQTIREMHSEPLRGNMVLFAKNLVEESLESMVDDGQQWVIEDMTRFQKLQTVRYSSIFEVDGSRIYPAQVKPGPILNEHRWYFYQTGDRFVFSGYGGVGATIDLAYYQFLPWLKYYPLEHRPATFDLETGWTYYDLSADGGTDYTASDETKELARSLVSNWMILGHYTCVQEGLRAKVYKRVSDTERARTSYSLYNSLRKQVYTTEAYSLG